MWAWILLAVGLVLTIEELFRLQPSYAQFLIGLGMTLTAIFILNDEGEEHLG